MDQDIANNIDCSDEELINNPQKCDVKKKEGSTTILVIFGGATLSLLLIYLILAFHKYVREQGTKEDNNEQVDNLQRDYEKFKKYKLLELQAIERQKKMNERNKKGKSSKSSTKKSDKSKKKNKEKKNSKSGSSTKTDTVPENHQTQAPGGADLEAGRTTMSPLQNDLTINMSQQKLTNESIANIQSNL